MDLRQFYLDNVSEQEYYYNFYELVNMINGTEEEIEEMIWGIRAPYYYNFLLDDTEDIIEKFKELCLPENENHTPLQSCWFYIILFYLKQKEYIIKEFPRLIQKPPLDSFDFVNKEVRNRLIAEGKVKDGINEHAERRKFINNLTFEQKSTFIMLDEEIEQKFRKISTRDASFQEMAKSEKLREINNLIENMLCKPNEKYVKLDYEKVCCEYINDEIVKGYRKKMQCFRHSNEKAIAERENYTEEQKNFLIDFGIIILKSIHSLLKEK